MVVFGQKWFYSGKVVVFEQKWLYSGKVVVFGKKLLLENNMYCCVTGGLAPQHHASFARHSVTRPFVLLLNKCH